MCAHREGIGARPIVDDDVAQRSCRRGNHKLDRVFTKGFFDDAGTESGVCKLANEFFRARSKLSFKSIFRHEAIVDERRCSVKRSTRLRWDYAGSARFPLPSELRLS